MSPAIFNGLAMEVNMKLGNLWDEVKILQLLRNPATSAGGTCRDK
jgi:hypothetical protein